ncbi:hypothetical protein GPOL_c15650 [Gordonia polyisoprenivorans VH2]|uniref:AbiEi antitoxin N-terminal domain-containing protein n=1 Tax=Gordonia polyisoprenivorans (strain DSM 44266 / VH2) TaxID=1112204 RepID=H6MTD0_GORPV|nr:type IV toxin-antitoxin system AbiEi family antitoxin domain-containing protein [Gordonia polyisoprenivorans]AFA72614.1 hypothetical protein GPOL_c15650 [Gordonia polyisoprenivorans VH2]
MTVAAPDTARLDDLLASQDGVITRGQVIDCGFSAAFVRRMVRRREWATVFPGVYVDHTGPLTARQRQWSAVLDAFPAALSHSSAILDGDVAPTQPVHIVVDRQRRVTRRQGVVVHYGSRLDDRVLWHARPPRLRIEEAVLDVVDASSSSARVVACLADAVQARRTTADRLLAALRRRPRIAHRRFVEGVLRDVRDGTCSVLEHGYLTKVERAHGLPAPIRQAPTTVGRRGLRDVEYVDFGLVVELDGRLGHDGPVARDRDLERDLDAAVHGDRLTLRLGWGQVYERPCATATKIARALRARGWRGTVAGCPACPSSP